LPKSDRSPASIQAGAVHYTITNITTIDKFFDFFTLAKITFWGKKLRKITLKDNFEAKL